MFVSALQMAGEGKRYLEPGLPFLYVKELTETNIEDCIAAIAGDRSLMNLYGGDLGNHWINEKQASHDACFSFIRKSAPPIARQ